MSTARQQKNTETMFDRDEKPKEQTEAINKTKSALVDLKNQVEANAETTAAVQSFLFNLATLYKQYPNGDIPEDVETEILAEIKENPALKESVSAILNNAISDENLRKEAAELATTLGDPLPKKLSAGEQVWKTMSDWIDRIIADNNLTDIKDKDGKVIVKPELLSAFLRLSKAFLMKQIANVAEALSPEIAADVQWVAQWMGLPENKRTEIEKRAGGVEAVRKEWETRYHDWLAEKARSPVKSTFTTPCPTIATALKVLSTAPAATPTEVGKEKKVEIQEAQESVTVGGDTVKLQYLNYDLPYEQLQICLKEKKFMINLTVGNEEILNPYAYVVTGDDGKQSLELQFGTNGTTSRFEFKSIIEQLQKTDTSEKKATVNGVELTFEPVNTRS